MTSSVESDTGLRNRSFLSCDLPLFINGCLSENIHKYANVFLLEIHFHTNQNNFHMNGFAGRLVLMIRTVYSVRLINLHLVVGCRSIWQQQTLLETNTRNQFNNYVIHHGQLLVFTATSHFSRV